MEKILAPNGMRIIITDKANEKLVLAFKFCIKMIELEQSAAEKCS